MHNSYNYNEKLRIKNAQILWIIEVLLSIMAETKSALRSMKMTSSLVNIQQQRSKMQVQYLTEDCQEVHKVNSAAERWTWECKAANDHCPGCLNFLMGHSSVVICDANLPHLVLWGGEKMKLSNLLWWMNSLSTLCVNCEVKLR